MLVAAALSRVQPRLPAQCVALVPSAPGHALRLNPCLPPPARTHWQGDLAARRQAASLVNGEAERHKLFTELAQRYAERAGGYTRIIRTGAEPSYTPAHDLMTQEVLLRVCHEIA